MKIQRLMLAVLAVCGTSAALAQSSVTIYGRVNTSIERQKIGDESVTGMFNNSSRIGFKGVEDLGGGLKVGFQLESGFASDTGAGSAAGGGINFGRQSEVNLAGNWGMVRLGNFTAESYYATADYVSWVNHDTGTSSDALYDYNMRDVNKISYRTPEMGGFWAEVAHSFHEKQAGAKNAWDLAANYNNGPLGLGLGYSRTGAQIAGVDTKGQQLGLRATYAIGALTLGGYYQYSKYDAGSEDAKRHAVRLAAMYTMGASEFHVNVGRAGKVKVSGDSGSGTAGTQWTLGYNYNLSKRTKVYTYYTRVNNGNNAVYGYGFNDSLAALQTSAGKDFSSFAVGVRHAF